MGLLSAQWPRGVTFLASSGAVNTGVLQAVQDTGKAQAECVDVLFNSLNSLADVPHGIQHLLRKGLGTGREWERARDFIRAWQFLDLLGCLEGLF